MNQQTPNGKPPDEGDRDLVEERQACPNCGERHLDELVWTEDGESVVCQTCGTRYIP